MKAIDLSKMIQGLAAGHGKRAFTLRDIVASSGESAPAVAMALLRLKRHGIVGRVGSLWINLLDRPPLSDVAFSLRAVSYVSFESALYERGVLSQAPQGVLSLATAGRPGRICTPLGEIEFVHLKPALFFGFDEKRMALPEKALLDLVSIRLRRGLDPLPGVTLYLEEIDRRRVSDFAEGYPRSVRDALEDILDTSNLRDAMMKTAGFHPWKGVRRGKKGARP